MKYTFSLVFGLVLTLPVMADDWKQFRGPGGRSVSSENKVPIIWSKTKNIGWKAKIPGRGLSNPIIAEGRVYVTSSSGWQQNRLHVLCFDEKTGKQLWHRQFWATGGTQSHPKTCMAAPTPVTDGKNVYALFATQDLVALDRDGNLLWYRSLTQDYPTIGNNVGMASSPTLWKDVLLVSVENVGESFAVGIDTKTGHNKWSVPRPRAINWASPIVIEKAGKAQVIFMAPDDMTAYDPATGKEIWTYKKGGLSRIPSVTFAEGLLLCPGKEMHAIEPGTKKTKPSVAWQERKLQCGYASPLVHNGKIYTLTSRGVLRCADVLTGEEVWSKRLEGAFAATPVLAGNQLYVVNEEGTTYVIKTGSGPNLIGTNSVEDKIMATPAIANGAIYLRSDDYVYCIREK